MKLERQSECDICGKNESSDMVSATFWLGNLEIRGRYEGDIIEINAKALYEPSFYQRDYGGQVNEDIEFCYECRMGVKDALKLDDVQTRLNNFLAKRVKEAPND